MHHPPPFSETIPILSLIVALLAVFVGPLITLRLGRKQAGLSAKQLELSRRIASKQIVAPMRQAWINNLRDKVAELTSGVVHCYNRDWRRPLRPPDEWKDEERKRLTLLEHEIQLLINPTEADHKELVETIRIMMAALDKGLDGTGHLFAAQEKVTAIGQRIFKAEWNRVKEEIDNPSGRFEASGFADNQPRVITMPYERRPPGFIPTILRLQ